VLAVAQRRTAQADIRVRVHLTLERPEALATVLLVALVRTIGHAVAALQRADPLLLQKRENKAKVEKEGTSRA